MVGRNAAAARSVWRHLVVTAAAVTLVSLLWTANPPLRVLDNLDDTRLDSLIVAACALIAWLCLAWTLTCLVLAMLTAVPGTVGQLARVVADRLTPRLVRRLVEYLLGFAVVVGSVGAPALAEDQVSVATGALASVPSLDRPAGAEPAPSHAAPSASVPSASASSAPVPSASASSASVPSASASSEYELAAPSVAEPAAAGSTGAGSLPTDPAVLASWADALDRPAQPAPAYEPAPSAPPTSASQISAPATSVSEPSMGEPSAPTPAAPAARGREPSGPALTGPAPSSSADRYVVRPGDTLWSIAARHLGSGASDAQIAREWPRWYAANSTVVGPNPQLIYPGQILRPPMPGAS